MAQNLGQRAARRQVWFVYLVRCADDTLYAGIAVNVAERIAAHEAGRGARYTRGRGPLTLRAVRRCKTKSDALRLEMAIKRLTRVEKLGLTSRRLAHLAKRLDLSRGTSRA